jgi:hypothetical protein
MVLAQSPRRTAAHDWFFRLAIVHTAFLIAERQMTPP